VSRRKRRDTRRAAAARVDAHARPRLVHNLVLVHGAHGVRDKVGRVRRRRRKGDARRSGSRAVVQAARAQLANARERRPAAGHGRRALRRRQELHARTLRRRHRRGLLDAEVFDEARRARSAKSAGRRGAVALSNCADP
jgi:hypothetical protein